MVFKIGRCTMKKKKKKFFSSLKFKLSKKGKSIKLNFNQTSLAFVRTFSIKQWSDSKGS